MTEHDSRASRRSAAAVLAVILAAFAALHAYWAVGGSAGLATVLGDGAPRPASTAIWAVAAVLVVFALCAFSLARGSGPEPLPLRIALWLLAAGAALVGVLNVVMGTRAAERLGIGPFAIVVAVLAAYCSIGPRRAVSSAAG